ncbi:hypothetical protein H4Q26_004348 [Puccinia striiformis f. sp. tritici PST-130]|nr:hypothetical protein H4Q26_004348 [Puccinia striiformis f. sp. tritici PST-130]
MATAKDFPDGRLSGFGGVSQTQGTFQLKNFKNKEFSGRPENLGSFQDGSRTTFGSKAVTETAPGFCDAWKTSLKPSEKSEGFQDGFVTSSGSQAVSGTYFATPKLSHDLNLDGPGAPPGRLGGGFRVALKTTWVSRTPRSCLEGSPKPPRSRFEQGAFEAPQDLPSGGRRAPCKRETPSSRLDERLEGVSMRENAFAHHLARESRTGKSKEPLKNNKPVTKTITCALMLYIDGTCVQSRGLLHTQQLVNLSDPNLYNNLRNKLWTAFEDDIMKYIGNERLPTDPFMHTFLGQREAKIPDQATLSHIIQEAGTRKKIAFDLMYHHPDDLGSSPGTSPHMKSQVNPLKRPYNKSAASSQKHQNPSSTKMATTPKATSKSWAVRGPSASKPVHRSLDMVSRLGQLSKNISSTSLVPSPKWITGHRLDFFTSTPRPDTMPPSTRFQLVNGIQGTHIQSATAST